MYGQAPWFCRDLGSKGNKTLCVLAGERFLAEADGRGKTAEWISFPQHPVQPKEEISTDSSQTEWRELRVWDTACPPVNHSQWREMGNEHGWVIVKKPLIFVCFEERIQTIFWWIFTRPVLPLPKSPLLPAAEYVSHRWVCCRSARSWVNRGLQSGSSGREKFTPTLEEEKSQSHALLKWVPDRSRLGQKCSHPGCDLPRRMPDTVHVQRAERALLLPEQHKSSFYCTFLHWIFTNAQTFPPQPSV